MSVRGTPSESAYLHFAINKAGEGEPGNTVMAVL